MIQKNEKSPRKLLGDFSVSVDQTLESGYVHLFDLIDFTYTSAMCHHYVDTLQ